MSEDTEETRDEVPETGESELREASVRVVRVGHGANCSSVGSVIDTLFLGAAVGGAIFAAVCAAMKVEPVTVVGGESHDDDHVRDRDDDHAGEGP